MTDAEFRDLEQQIEAAYRRLDDLQSKYEHETGRRYYPPLRVGPAVPYILRRQAD